jgi:predicted nucleotide-binding protein
MPYYHVYIDTDGDELTETDFSKEGLIKFILKPYNQQKKFMCKGTTVHPSDITTIRILETKQPASEIVPKIKMERGLAGLLSSDFHLLEETGEDVTREFIKPSFRRKTKRTSQRKRITGSSKDIFIVHGRDHTPMKELKTMLLEFGLNPVVLHEQPSGSRTIVEKLEKYSDVGYAFVILTPDDIGCLNIEASKTLQSIAGTLQNLIEAYTVIKHKGPLKRVHGELSKVASSFKPRARQNVVLEFGYFIGFLGRDRVCCLYKGDVELPSDMHGIVYIPFKQTISEVKDKIIKELEATGYKPNVSKEEVKKDNEEEFKKLNDDIEMLKRRDINPR